MRQSGELRVPNVQRIRERNRQMAMARLAGSAGERRKGMRLTTDTPKNNFEMALNLFYAKDKEVWVRGYGKNGADISLFDLSRDLTRWNCPYVDLDISDDSFSMMMAEWLWEDVESFEHVLALLYQAAWVCAELREHLKQFEDKEDADGATNV